MVKHRHLLFSRAPSFGIDRSLTTGCWRIEEREKQLIYEIEPGREVWPKREEFLKASGREAPIAKRIRAHDGCLGIRRLRRTRKTATSSGEPSTGFDPEVSEWGNPAAFTGRHPGMNQIVPGSYTRGSETSQYPEEKRSTEIARVAASESARAQTGKLASRGCGTRTRHRNG